MLTLRQQFPVFCHLSKNCFSRLEAFIFTSKMFLGDFSHLSKYITVLFDRWFCHKLLMMVLGQKFFWELSSVFVITKLGLNNESWLWMSLGFGEKIVFSQDSTFG